MAKYDAMGTILKMGIRQTETALVVGDITGNGDATFTLTKNGMTGSAIATSVAVLSGDSPTTVATKAAAALNLVANITAVCEVYSTGPYVVVKAKTAVANDATFNLAYTNDTCTGLTPDATSTDTTAGVALTAIAQIGNISGPSLVADTEDVTTHDSTNGFEEVVVTVLRTGEATLDIVYDPAAATHAATAGLLARLKNKTNAQFQIVFPDSAATTWTLDGYCTSFEPSAPSAGALTASATIKFTGAPTLV